MPLVFQLDSPLKEAERREPPGNSQDKRHPKAGGLAPCRFKVSGIGPPVIRF